MSKQKITDEDIILALLTSESKQEACRMLGVGHNYIDEKLKQEEFRQAYRDYKQKQIEKTTEQLVVFSLDAVRTLHRLLNDNNGAVAVSAAKSILTYAKDYIMLSDLEQRIAELERLNK